MLSNYSKVTLARKCQSWITEQAWHHSPQLFIAPHMLTLADYLASEPLGPHLPNEEDSHPITLRGKVKEGKYLHKLIREWVLTKQRITIVTIVILSKFRKIFSPEIYKKQPECNPALQQRNERWYFQISHLMTLCHISEELKALHTKNPIKDSHWPPEREKMCIIISIFLRK